jgi:PAS domain S-box-containing protein
MEAEESPMPSIPPPSDALLVLPSLVSDVLEALPVAVLVLDGEGRIRHLNAALVALLGYTREQLLGRHLELLLPESVRGAHEAWRREFMAAPAARQMGSNRDLCCRRADGSLLPVEIGLRAHDAGLR